MRPTHQSLLTARNAVLGSLVFAALLNACGGGDQISPGIDQIEIVEVTPAVAQTGRTTEFTVTFRYVLRSHETGTVDLGLFMDQTNQLLTGQRLPVGRGTGQGSLKIAADPGNYTAADEFLIGVLLSQEPHPESWTPLARAKATVRITAPAAPRQ